ncbi:aminoglycoside phosphotransferase family protein [Bacillus sp. JJ664]
MIKQNVRSHILKKYNINENDFLGKGQEAEVYSYHQDRVFKLYQVSAFEKQKILKSFYESMNENVVNFNLPKIYEIIKEKEAVITIEKRIEGRNIQKALSNFDYDQLNAFFKQYLSTILSIKEITLEHKIDGHKLLRDYEMRNKPADWNEFLKQSLIQKNKEVEMYLMKDVKDYESKYLYFLNVLSKKYEGEYDLIHGDFYPSNLLVKDDGKINGVIDFGLMTMSGDYLFDVALSWILFDLYDELGAVKLNHYVNMIIEKIGEQVKESLFFYALYYSYYSANFFSENCSDGHYEWSVRNLNNETYWAELKDYKK